MTRTTVSLAPGSQVSYRGENWFIAQAEDFVRVLGSRVSDGYREFLPVSELGPPISGGSAPPGQHAPRTKKSELTPDTRLDQDRGLRTQISLYRASVAVAKLPRGSRRDAVERLRKKFGLSLASAYRKVAIVEAGGDADALARAQRKDKQGVGSRVGAERRKVVEAGLRKYHFVDSPRTVEDAVELINGDLRERGLAEVSRSFIFQIRNEVSYKKRLELQGKKKQARDEFRPSVGHLPDNDYPLAIVQVDHTPCQICFVDEETRGAIGDAWLTLVIDCYSRMVLGFYLSFGGPSTLSTGLALSRAFLPKDTLLRRIEVRGEWPCWGFPDVVLVDNAAELNGHMMQTARNTYRFTIRNRPIGAPNFGGHVESAFKTFMYEFKSVPGTKFSNPVERAEYDSEGRAILTLREFEWYFTDFLVNDYHLAAHGGEGMDRRTPLQRWKAGIFEGDVFGPVGLPDIPADPEALQISLMPIEWRTISNATVSIFTESYYSGALAQLGDSVDLTKPLDERLFEIRYDPRDISKIWVKDPDAGVYIEAPLSDLRKPSISLWEHNARKRAMGAPADEFKTQRYESKKRREDFKETKAKQTKRARREAERAKRDAAESLVKPSKPKKPAKPPQAPPRKSIAEIQAEMRRRMEQQGGG